MTDMIDNEREQEKKVFGLHDRERGILNPPGNSDDFVGEVGRQLTRFLDETEHSIDDFFKGIRKSADQALSVAEDHRLQSYAAVLLAGAAVGALAASAWTRVKRVA